MIKAILACDEEGGVGLNGKNAVATHSNRLSMVYGPDQRTCNGHGTDDMAGLSAWAPGTR